MPVRGLVSRFPYGRRTPSKKERAGFYNTPAWKRMQARYYAEYDRACRICGGNKRVDLHHATYERWGGRERLSDLVALCPHHHTGKGGVHWFHRELLRTERGVTIEEATARYLAEHGVDEARLRDLAARQLMEDYEAFMRRVER